MSVRCLTHLLVFALILPVAPGASSSEPDPLDAIDDAGDLAGQPITLQRIDEMVYMATGLSNVYLVKTGEGEVLIDTGFVQLAAKQKAALSEISSGTASHIVLTHSHGDHFSGTHLWRNEDTRVIAHRDFSRYMTLHKSLHPYFNRRNRFLYPYLPAELPSDWDTPHHYYNQQPTDLVEPGRPYRFELGGVRFEVLATPGAEGVDSISVWMPDQRILFSGDLFGPTTFPMWPNLTTIRGEWFRPPLPYLESLDAVIALEPELILPGHFGPHRGREENLRKLRLQRDSLRYVHDRVIEGMNEGKTVYELMGEIQLPKHLAVPQNHGKISWTVRGIWEHYADWFYFDATSPLYPIAPRSVHPEIVEMAGGAGVVASRARVLLERGDVLRALLLVEMAETADPTNAQVIDTTRAVTRELIRRAGEDPLTTNFTELFWLRAKLRALDD